MWSGMKGTTDNRKHRLPPWGASAGVSLHIFMNWVLDRNSIANGSQDIKDNQSL